jgi:hypothetical protein
MNSPNSISPLFVAREGGWQLHAFGDQIIIHLDGSQTGGRFTLFTDITPLPGYATGTGISGKLFRQAKLDVQAGYCIV